MLRHFQTAQQVFGTHCSLLLWIHLLVVLLAAGLLQGAQSVLALEELQTGDGASALSVQDRPHLLPFLRRKYISQNKVNRTVGFLALTFTD